MAFRSCYPMRTRVVIKKHIKNKIDTCCEYLLPTFIFYYFQACRIRGADTHSRYTECDHWLHFDLEWALFGAIRRHLSSLDRSKKQWVIRSLSWYLSVNRIFSDIRRNRQLFLTFDHAQKHSVALATRHTQKQLVEDTAFLASLDAIRL